VSPEFSLVAIRALVPGDSGGKTEFLEVKMRCGITGSGGEIVER